MLCWVAQPDACLGVCAAGRLCHVPDGDLRRAAAGHEPPRARCSLAPPSRVIHLCTSCPSPTDVPAAAPSLQARCRLWGRGSPAATPASSRLPPRAAAAPTSADLPSLACPALFSPEAVASVPGAADQTADGGDEAAALAPVEKPVEAGAGGRAGAGGKSALALTTVHLWRVECRQLFADLWRLQPEVLLHLLDQLLAGGVGDGAGDASEGGAAAAPGAAPCQQAAPGAAPLGGTTGDKDGQQERARLLRLRSKIAAVAATVEHQAHQTHDSHHSLHLHHRSARGMPNQAAASASASGLDDAADKV